jgi:hypothetical protein
MYLHICLWMCMDSAHRKMDRISFQPLHWDNRQAATGRFFFLSISLPFFHIYRDQTRDRWGGKPIDDPLPQHNSSSLIILHFFLLCVQWMSYGCLSALVRLLLFRALLSRERDIRAFPLDLLLLLSLLRLFAINKLRPISSHVLSSDVRHRSTAVALHRDVLTPPAVGQT